MRPHTIPYPKPYTLREDRRLLSRKYYLEYQFTNLGELTGPRDSIEETVRLLNSAYELGGFDGYDRDRQTRKGLYVRDEVDLLNRSPYSKQAEQLHYDGSVLSGLTPEDRIISLLNSAWQEGYRFAESQDPEKTPLQDVGVPYAVIRAISREFGCALPPMEITDLRVVQDWVARVPELKTLKELTQLIAKKEQSVTL